MFLDPTKFEIIAGHDLVEQMRAAREASVEKTASGFYDSEDICRIQQAEARKGILGVEVCESLYGFSVRYDSGLQDWGLVASSRYGQLDGSVEDAFRFAREWVAKDPTRRYAWIRKNDVYSSNGGK